MAAPSSQGCASILRSWNSVFAKRPISNPNSTFSLYYSEEPFCCARKAMSIFTLFDLNDLRTGFNCSITSMDYFLAEEIILPFRLLPLS